MKHYGFLKSLKTLKSQIAKEKQNKRKNIYTYEASKQEKNYCKCRDSEGIYKYLYSSHEDIEYLLASKDIRLKSYACPYEKGWHLSKY